MFKKLIFFIGFSVLILVHLDELYADGNLILPLKKPILTNQELDEKILIINYCYPL